MAAQFSYFTTSDDLREIVKQVDANTQFQYIEYKNFSESEYPNARMYDSLLEYPHLGYARSAQCRGDMFLVLNRTQALCPKIIPTDEGSRIVVSQELNTPSIVWALGGHRFENLLLKGEVSTICSDNVSKQMMADVRKVFSRYCKKVDGYYVSPGVFLLSNMNEARFSNIFIEKRASTCPQSLEKSRLFSYALLVSECENFQNMKRIFLRKVVI